MVYLLVFRGGSSVNPTTWSACYRLSASSRPSFASCWHKQSSRHVVSQYVHAIPRSRNNVALPFLRQRSHESMASLSLAHGSTINVSLLPSHLQSHRYSAHTFTIQASGTIFQTLKPSHLLDRENHLLHMAALTILFTHFQ